MKDLNLVWKKINVLVKGVAVFLLSFDGVYSHTVKLGPIFSEPGSYMRGKIEAVDSNGDFVGLGNNFKVCLLSKEKKISEARGRDGGKFIISYDKKVHHYDLEACRGSYYLLKKIKTSRDLEPYKYEDHVREGKFLTLKVKDQGFSKKCCL